MQFFVQMMACADMHALSRVDTSTLPEQTLMELTVENISDISHFQDADGAYLDISRWQGLFFDSSGNVSEIRFAYLFSAYFKCGGTIELQWLPRSVEKIQIGRNDLEGTCDTYSLPRGLKNLGLFRNQLTGKFEISTLPPEILTVIISTNKFEGSLDIVTLPKSVTRFAADHNLFSGSLDLSELPEGLRYLSFDVEAFDPAPDLSTIPAHMDGLNHRDDTQSVLFALSGQ